MAKRAQSAPHRKKEASSQGGGEGSENKGISQHEIETVEEMSTPRTPVIYEVVRRLGDEELERPVTSLIWSGLAAGLSMSFSLLAQSALHDRLPDTGWRPLVAGFGYSVGFVMTVMARQQLFTESTITVVLPVLGDLTWHNLARMIRLWSIVLVANLVGTLFAAVYCQYAPVMPDWLLGSMHGISRDLLPLSWWDMFFRAISAGFLIAAMVWMIPTAENQQFFVITLMTWLISISGATHVVAGSMEAYLLVLSGDWEWWRVPIQFILPVLLGNIVGGTALFAAISYAQVVKEI
jgi:formate/nitrite transporter FocA (FNT family)